MAPCKISDAELMGDPTEGNTIVARIDALLGDINLLLPGPFVFFFSASFPHLIGS
jgi:hypothetical protein